MLADPGIVRNRLKVRATIINAGKFLEVQKEYGKPKTKESDAMSKDLKKVDSNL